MELIVQDLAKQYKNKRAVDGVSLRLTEGINGLLSAKRKFIWKFQKNFV